MEFLIHLLTILVVFLIFGGIVKIVLDRFMGEIEVKKEEEESENSEDDSEESEGEASEEEYLEEEE